MLDYQGRVFVMGDTGRGKLGLMGKLKDKVELPTQVTYGLPSHKEISNRIVEVFAGGNHTMAISKAGEIYTWGEGKSGRLGLGYLEEN